MQHCPGQGDCAAFELCNECRLLDVTNFATWPCCCTFLNPVMHRGRPSRLNRATCFQSLLGPAGMMLSCKEHQGLIGHLVI